jgi:hypothetical protein
MWRRRSGVQVAERLRALPKPADQVYNNVIEGLAAFPELSERNLGVIWREGGKHWHAAAQAAGGGKE